MSRRSPTSFVFSVAAEVIAVVFIVSVLPRVDLRRSAGASPTADDRNFQGSESPSLLPLPNWSAAADSQRERAPHETSYYQQRTQPTASSAVSPPAVSPPANRDLPAREPAPLITVDPARPGYVEQRLDRASQDLVNTVGSYVSQAASDLLPVQPTAPTPQRTATQPYAPALSRLPPAAASPALPFSPTPATSGSFPTQPQSPSPPRPWVRY